MAEKTVQPRFALRDTRLAFPNLQTKGKFGFGARLIIPPDHVQVVDQRSRQALASFANIKLPPDLKAKVKTIPLLKQIGLAIAREKWSTKGDAYFKALEAQDKLFLHDGNTKSEWEGFEGNMFVSAGAKGPVTMWDQARNEISESDGIIYSGCFVVASIWFWAQDNTEGGKRLNCNLRGVQKLRDGDSFSGAGTPADQDEFDEIAMDEETTDGGEAEMDLTA